MTVIAKLGNLFYMVKDNSEPPISLGNNTLVFRVRWGYVIAALVIIGGGGWGTLLKASVFEPEGQAAFKEACRSNDSQHADMSQKLKAHDGLIESIGDTVRQIRQDIIQDRASREAHRLTDSIKEPAIRAAEYDRLLRENERRLQRNQAPCYTRDCGG